MPLESGRRLGPYEIVAPIGAGGMGEVYRARDTRLARTVAVKILPAALSGDAQLRQRFEREAKVISSLNHPHICTLYDVGSDSGVDYLVLEHLEGETLDQRIARGPLPLDDVFRYATEIADALDKAHRRGITHRDLKPSNVMITKSGAKLLDFGLARPSDGELDAAVSLFTGETMKMPITTEGVIVGTFQYMAPEQVEGKPTDARSDIFAFGALLYEMLTGKRAFDGKSRASVIAAILATDPPPVSDVRSVAPASLDRVVRLCLIKDPDERWQSAHDLKLELEAAREAQNSVTSVSSSRRFARVPWIIAGALAVAALATGFYQYRSAKVPRGSMQFQILPPEGTIFGDEDSPAAISPDGKAIMVRLGRPGSEQPLMIRRLDSLEFKPLTGTEGGFDAFWSPDGTQIGFAVARKLMRISRDGGPVSTICAVDESRGAAWLDDDTILVAPGPAGPIMAVPPAGGTPRPVTRLDKARKETGHWRPTLLPGRKFLYVAHSAQRELSGVYAASLDSGEVKRILDVASTTIYAEPGWILYHHDGALLAQRFDAAKLEKSGAPIPVVDSVSYFTRWAQGAYHATSSALLAYHPGRSSEEGELIRITAGNSAANPIGARGVNLDISDDGNRVAFMRVDRETQAPDIWVHDLRREITTRVTFDPAGDVGPVWSPDGTRLAYMTARDAGIDIMIANASGTGDPKRIFSVKHGLEVVDWSSDGRWLLIEAFRDAGSDVVALDLNDPKAFVPLAASKFNEMSARFSPDGKWFAYVSDESGQREIYAQPFPPDGRKVQISVGGGDAPRWRSNGRQLFYVANRDERLMGVDFQGGDPQNPSRPREILRGVTSDLVVEPSGESIITTREGTAAPTPIVAITNWTERLTRRQ